MECREAAELLDSYVLGALDPREKEEVERHLASCADCESQLSEAGEVAVQMAYSVPRLVAPDRVMAGLFERIDRLEPSASRPQRSLGVVDVLRAIGGFWRSSASGCEAPEPARARASRRAFPGPRRRLTVCC